MPARLLWAERGLRDEPTGLYHPQVVEAAGLDGVALHFVPGVNHYSIVLGARGAGVVAGHIREALHGTP